MKRGDIYYVLKSIYQGEGSEQKISEQGRPAIIISNNINNMHSTVVTVVYLTTKPKTNLPTHVNITTSKENSTAICEQINTVSVNRIQEDGFKGHCTEAEMARVDAAVRVALALNNHAAEPVTTTTQITAPATHVYTAPQDNVQLTIERDFYKKMYNDILQKCLER